MAPFRLDCSGPANIQSVDRYLPCIGNRQCFLGPFIRSGFWLDAQRDIAQRDRFDLLPGIESCDPIGTLAYSPYVLEREMADCSDFRIVVAFEHDEPEGIRASPPTDRITYGLDLNVGERDVFRRTSVSDEDAQSTI